MTDHPAAIAERERIVAWLLSDEDGYGAWLTYMYEDLGLEKRAPHVLADYLLTKFATAILNRDHITQSD